MPTTEARGALYATSRQFRDDLERGNAQAAEQMHSAWLKAYRQSDADLATLLDRVALARERGETVSPSWLYREQRLRNVRARAVEQMHAMAVQAVDLTAQRQASALAQGLGHADRLLASATPDVLAGGFIQVNQENLRHLVGHTADGSPLKRLFSSLPGDAGAGIQSALVKGVTLGWGIDKMRREAQVALAIPRWRAETILRTEALRTYRAASNATYMANADVLDGWTWHASLDGRCCAACTVMDGTLHDVGEILDGHPRCRCAMVPRTKSWEELGVARSDVVDRNITDTRPPVRSGKAWLEQQAPAIQRGILGKGKYDAWKAGDISLDDVVARADDPDWGTMRRERSLTEIRAGRNANPPTRTVQATRTPDITDVPSDVLRTRLNDGPLEQRYAAKRELDRRRHADQQAERLARKALADQVKTLDDETLLDRLLASTKGTPEYETLLGEQKRRMLDRQVADRKAALEMAKTETPAWLDSLPRRDEISGTAADIVDQASLRPTTNPRYREGRTYQVNCTHVVSTYEMRRRGYDVVATALPEKYVAAGGRHFDSMYREMWDQPAGVDLNDQVLIGTRLQNEKAMKSWGEGARATIRVQWSGRSAGGHVFVAEVRDGRVIYLDPQTGNLAPDYWARVAGKPFYYRMDNVAPTAPLRELMEHRPGAVVTEAPKPVVPVAETRPNEWVNRDAKPIPQSVVDALQPKRGGYFVKTAAETQKALAATPEGRRLSKVLANFQQGGSTAIPRLRTDMMKRLKGEALEPGRRDSVDVLLDAIRATTYRDDKALHRGMVIPGDLEDVLATYKPGDTIDMAASSFTSDPKVAADFSLKGAGQRVKGSGPKTSVVVEWSGPGKHAVPIENLAKSNVVNGEREWVTAGRFRVTEARKVKRGGRDVVLVKIQQVETW